MRSTVQRSQNQGQKLSLVDMEATANSSASRERSTSPPSSCRGTNQTPHQSANLRSLNQEGPTTPSTDIYAREVYFSPITISNSKVELSDPLPTPPSTQKSTKSGLTKRRSDFKNSPGGKLRLTQQHLERLAKAFIDSPLVKVEVCKRRAISSEWEVTEKTSTADDHDHKPMRVKLKGIAITDTRKAGSPIRFTTKSYTETANVLTVGRQNFLNFPYGEDFGCDCCIRVEPSTDDGSCKVLVSLINEVLDRWTGTGIYNLVAEVDVSEGVWSAVLAEFDVHSGVSTDDTVITTDTEALARKKRSVDENEVDWCQLADELQAEYELDSSVDATAELFARLDIETCTPRTKSLISDLERLKQKHTDFVILSTTHSSTAVDDDYDVALARMGVPWISQHFEWKLHDELRLPEAERREFRRQLVEVVAKTLSTDNKPFSTAVVLHGIGVRVFCAPLEGSHSGEVEALVCFVDNFNP